MNSRFIGDRARIGEWGGFVAPRSGKTTYKSDDTYIYAIYRANQKKISEEFTTYEGWKKHVKSTMKREGYSNVKDAVYAISRTTRFTGKAERGLQNIQTVMTESLRQELASYGIKGLNGFNWVRTGKEKDRSGRYEYFEKVKTPDGPKTLVLEFKSKYDSQTEDIVRIVLL